MIKKNIVLVFGAGASFPYGFPLGKTLKSMIETQILSPSKDKHLDLNELLLGFDFTMDELQKFAKDLRSSMQPSVDAFLFERKEYLDIGKLAIAANLVTCENEENLTTGDSEETTGRWYGYLLNNFLGTRNEFINSNLSIVTFNYDRSLEYFLFLTLQSRFQLTEEETASYIERYLPIVHVYGQLGMPHFIETSAYCREYIDTIDLEILWESAQGIDLIYDDKRTNTGAFELAHNLISESDMVIFIGFGYHEKNLERLMLNKYYRTTEIYGTFYKMKPGEVLRARDAVYRQSALPHKVRVVSYSDDALNFLKNENILV